MKQATKDLLEALAIFATMVLFASLLIIAQAHRKPHTCTDKCKSFKQPK